MKQILINIEPYEKRVAITRKNVLEEFHIERTGQPRLPGSIYKAVIDAIVPGIGAIFANIGTDKNGFLYIDDVEEKSVQMLLDEEIVIEKRGPSRQRKLLDRLKKGQELMVQVVKEPIGTKGPLLTTDISLPGKYLVLMPYNDTVGISKRIIDRDKRSQLKEVLKRMKPPHGIGYIARTQSVNAAPRQLKLELRYLLNLWSRIRRRAEREKAPSLVYEEYDLPLRVIRDSFDQEIDKILVDSKEEYKKIVRFVGSVQPRLKKKIFYYRGRSPLYERFGVEEHIQKIFRRKVYVKSGGHIIIEQTEGLVAIDVNTGKYKGKRELEETAFKTNTEAASEIARQVMLRDIGGIIIIDFIDMMDRLHRKHVYETLEDAFKRDKAKINILTISSIGIVEMTRQRVRKSLESVSFTECPYCNGMGRVKTPVTISIEVLRKLERAFQDRKRRSITLILHPDVVDYMEHTFKKVLQNFERKYRRRVAIKGDPKLHVEDVYFE
jgi:ribonuclease G